MINGRIYSSSAVPRVCRSYLPRRCWKISRLIENDDYGWFGFCRVQICSNVFKYLLRCLEVWGLVPVLVIWTKNGSMRSDWGGTLSQTWPQHLNYWIYRWFSRMFIWFSQLITFILYPSIDSYQGFSWIFRRCSSVFDDFPWLRLGDWWSFWPP